MLKCINIVNGLSFCNILFINRLFDMQSYYCLLYTSDAADEEDSVDLGGRQNIKKKKIF